MPDVQLPTKICRLAVAAIFAISLSGSISLPADSSGPTTARQPNTKAHGLIVKGQAESSIEGLILRVKQNPGSLQARQNLAAAYYNLGLKNREKPTVSIDYLWRSMALDMNEPDTVKSLQSAVKLMGKDPTSPSVHVALAQDCLNRNCLYGAYLEYMEALWLKPDEKLADDLRQLDEKIRLAPQYGSLNWLAKFARTDLPEAEIFVPNALDIALQTYMKDVQGKIKRHWNVKNFAKKSNSMIVQFEVKRNGAISNLRVTVSSGDLTVDQAGLRAVQEIGTAPPLPPGTPESVTIEFSFNYNLGSVEASRAAILKDLDAKSKELSTLESQGIVSKRFLPKKLVEIGEIELLLGNYQKAYDTFIRAVELYRTAPRLNRGLLAALAGKADCQQLLEDRNAAADTLSEALAIAENDLHLKDSEIVSLLELSGKVLYKDNKIEQAEKLYERVRKAKATN